MCQTYLFYYFSIVEIKLLFALFDNICLLKLLDFTVIAAETQVLQA
jgi:hypothetical protein